MTRQVVAYSSPIEHSLLIFRVHQSVAYRPVRPSTSLIICVCIMYIYRKLRASPKMHNDNVRAR